MNPFAKAQPKVKMVHIGRQIQVLHLNEKTTTSRQSSAPFPILVDSGTSFKSFNSLVLVMPQSELINVSQDEWRLIETAYQEPFEVVLKQIYNHVHDVFQNLVRRDRTTESLHFQADYWCRQICGKLFFEVSYKSLLFISYLVIVGDRQMLLDAEC